MILQLLFNTLVSGLLLALAAVGFNLIFNTTKVFHLAHGALYVCTSFLLLQFLKLTPEASFFLWSAAFLGSILTTIGIAWLVEWLVYQPLHAKRSGQAITLISSIGVYLFLVNLIAMFYGNETKFLNPNLGSSLTLGSFVVVPIQLVQLITSIGLLAVILALTRTRWYLKVRAMISEASVASVMGVNTKSIRMWALAIGASLAGVASILRLYDTGIDPQQGMGVTLSAAVAVIVGGQDSIKGTILACLIIALLQTSTEWFFSSQWKDGITFLLLILGILWRTEGIVSFKMRVEER